jgi:ribosomal protein S18 acetylase RimI-like enzyme
MTKQLACRRRNSFLTVRAVHFLLWTTKSSVAAWLVSESSSSSKLRVRHQRSLSTQPTHGHSSLWMSVEQPEFTIRDCEYSGMYNFSTFSFTHVQMFSTFSLFLFFWGVVLLFRMRRPTTELGAVANIIIEAFYTNKNMKTLYRLAELNRLQQNFPYIDSDIHKMLVAVSSSCGDEINNNKSQAQQSPQIVGFCDIDARPSKTKPPLPRPYLSDLSVSTNFRRKGVARALVKKSEAVLREKGQRDELFIRVQESNVAAVTMYHAMDYQTLDCQQDKGLGNILLLHKRLPATTTSDVVDDDDDNNDDGSDEYAEGGLLDYVEP